MSDQAKAAAIAAIELHERLIARFAKITDVYEMEYARISINGDEAKIVWPETSSMYDDCGIEPETRVISAALLFISDDELNAWKDEQKRIANEQSMMEKAAFDHSVEAIERAALAMLKAKYEPQP